MHRSRAVAMVLAMLPLLFGCEILGGAPPALFGSGGTGQDDASMPDAGAAALHLGMTGLAVSHFEGAVAHDPSSASAWNGLGAAYDVLGRRDLARRAYARALALAPASAEPLNNMGASYHADGRYDLAVAMLRGASAGDGGHPIIAANRDAAERALAAAGGPPVKSGRRPPPIAAPPAPFRPRIVRTGRGELTLVTRPRSEPGPAPPSAFPGVAASQRPDDLLRSSRMPDYVAAPLEIDHPPPLVGRARAALVGRDPP